MEMYDCLPCSFSPILVRAIFADLQQARVITGFESKKLRDPSGVVRVQSKKSPEVMAITADILRAHGFANESQLLLGKQTRPSFPCLCHVVCIGAFIYKPGQTSVINTVVPRFLVPLHIAHCSHSHDYSVGTAESYVLCVIRVHARLCRSNTVQYCTVQCAFGTRNCEMIVTTAQ